ncbi:unnamed protein product [Phytophthora lilii]|uniref:Unnamed protein product n=1 Tax=Phytophthora lilii TaxID=2077276 RepID=A0A9W6TUV1_9STRA|nr:unnamed protein product [Phytophthora lilii]
MMSVAWGLWIDAEVDEQSRWHSAGAASESALGDHLVNKLKRAARTRPDATAIVRCASELRKRLDAVEKQKRLLSRLAVHGEVVLVLQHATEAALGILGLLDTPARHEWNDRLQREREEQVREYEKLLQDEELLRTEVGDETEQLETLVVLKNSFDRDGDLLTPRELDVTSAVYDAVANLTGVVSVTSPTTSESEWAFSEKMSMESEEHCIRQAIIWKELNHPNILKIYGACHVGEPAIMNEASNLDVHPSWREFLGCARALRYVHERGFAHSFFPSWYLRASRITGGQGLMYGLGLVPIGEAFRYTVSYDTWAQREGDDIHPSVAFDVREFGHRIFEILLLPGCKYDYDQASLTAPSITGRLPDTRPEFLNEAQWNLLVSMCAAKSADRIGMSEVINQIEEFARKEPDPETGDSDEGPAKREHEDIATTIADVSSYRIQSLDLTLQGTLDDVKELCAEFPEFSDVNEPVYARLLDVYKQLQVCGDAVPVSLAENFGEILLRFYDMLDRNEYPTESIVASVCAARTVAGKNYNIHHDIDRLIFSSPLLNKKSAVHLWEPKWKQNQQKQHNILEAHLEDPTTYLNQVNEANRREALALLQFEAANHVGARSAPSRLAAQVFETEMEEAMDLPPWFIPPYEVSLGKHIADGSFGAVYYGEWLGTNVVVKQVLTDQLDRTNRAQFRQEANLWFSLNHVNLIKLYGACHEGHPFFVCEKATGGTICSFVKGKGQWETWDSIRDAARGLKHLHDSSIVHGDLKGNNILICEDGLAKLADFGLSSVANRAGVAVDSTEGALGAFRWKAPECILGQPPTLASDIFSFGMCIIEIVSGDFPWGKEMSDSAVKYEVAEKKSIPQLPKGFRDSEWELVIRMCAYEPERRINAGAVVSFLEDIY